MCAQTWRQKLCVLRRPCDEVELSKVWASPAHWHFRRGHVGQSREGTHGMIVMLHLFFRWKNRELKSCFSALGSVPGPEFQEDAKAGELEVVRGWLVYEENHGKGRCPGRQDGGSVWGQGLGSTLCFVHILSRFVFFLSFYFHLIICFNFHFGGVGRRKGEKCMNLSA